MSGSDSNFDLNWDVDKYRSPHEPRHHWELKRKFMEANKARFPEERVVCLTQTFANIEFMGCKYPKETMDLVEELAFGVVQEYRETQKGRVQRTFISGSGAAGNKINRVNTESSSSSSSSRGNKWKRKNDTPVFESTSVKRPNYSNFVASTSNVANKLREVNLDPLSRFIIVRLDYRTDEPSCNILNRSAGFCRMPAVWDFQYKSKVLECVIKINGRLVASSLGDSKSGARDSAALKTLEILSKKCYTILIKSQYASDGTRIDIDEFESPLSNKAIESGNIGHKLLKLMGWSGSGGLGAGGSGISEPITANSIMNREGLGSKTALNKFKQKVRKIIEDYALSSNPYDLVFSTGFDNTQRKEIHMVAKRLGLKSKSFGRDEDRFITISRKVDSQQLLEDLIRRGGDTEKYSLIPPMQNEIICQT